MKPRILVVEDEPEVREAFLQWLRQEGILAVGAGSLKEGTEFLDSGLWDLLLADLKLPDGSGTDLVRHAAGLSIPSLVLTGAATVEDARKCFQLGARDLLTKPVERGRLLEMVRSLCPARGPDGDRYGVLVVEDDRDVAQALLARLEEEGLDAVWTADPEEGLRLCDGRAFPVLLSDWKLPGMDGLRFIEGATARIKPRPFTVLMTGHGSVERAVDSTKRGVDEYLEKPFDPRKLCETVQRGLQRALWSRLPMGMAPGTTYAATGGSPAALDALLDQVRRAGVPVVFLAWGPAPASGGRRALDLSQTGFREGLRHHPRAALLERLAGLERRPRMVVLDAWEPLRADLGFDAALRVVQGLRELAEEHGCAGLVPVERAGFTEAEWARFTWGLRLLDLAGPAGRAEVWRRTLENLHGDEKRLFGAVLDAGGAALQSDLVGRLGLSKPKVTRVLNRMESRGLLERKREGLGNRVVLK